MCIRDRLNWVQGEGENDDPMDPMDPIVLIFKTHQSGQLTTVLDIKNNYLEPEMYSHDLETYSIDLSFQTIENESASPINLYPNPVKDLLTINGEGIETVTIFSATGQILEFLKKEASTKELIHFSMDSYPAGVYWIDVSGKSFQVTEKIILLSLIHI